jgi:hypothetical protein
MAEAPSMQVQWPNATMRWSTASFSLFRVHEAETACRPFRGGGSGAVIPSFQSVSHSALFHEALPFANLGCLQRYFSNPILCILHLQISLQDSLLYISFLSNNVL